MSEDLFVSIHSLEELKDFKHRKSVLEAKKKKQGLNSDEEWDLRRINKRLKWYEEGDVHYFESVKDFEESIAEMKRNPKRIYDKYH